MTLDETQIVVIQAFALQQDQHLWTQRLNTDLLGSQKGTQHECIQVKRNIGSACTGGVDGLRGQQKTGGVVDGDVGAESIVVGRVKSVAKLLDCKDNAIGE